MNTNPPRITPSGFRFNRITANIVGIIAVIMSFS
jgi:hypothetical protein